MRPTLKPDPVRVFFHPAQLAFKPRYEWALGERVDHPETTARAESIVDALRADDAFVFDTPPALSRSELRGVHAPALLSLYEHTTALDDDLYPTVFPRGDGVRADPANLLHAGWWCFDAGTPINGQMWAAAQGSASAAIQAARSVIDGAPLAYSLSRPPGHHATRDRFGGYCYLNNSGLAAKTLRRAGADRVAIVDIDYHHGNGTQSLFWRDPTVLTLSIHADPRTDFPYFTGFREEVGAGRGAGFNLNLCEERGCDGARYRQILERYVEPALRKFQPRAVIVAAGLDTYELDPLGHFKLTTDDLRDVGEIIGRWGWPMVAVQEGGYHAGHLGRNAKALLLGLRAGAERSTRRVEGVFTGK